MWYPVLNRAGDSVGLPRLHLCRRPDRRYVCHEPAYGHVQGAGDTSMLAAYIDEALERARYEIIEDEGTYWGENRGVYLCSDEDSAPCLE